MRENDKGLRALFDQKILLLFWYYIKMNMQDTQPLFFVVAYEAGAENTPVPTWASTEQNPLKLDASPLTTVNRSKVKDVPAACQLTALLTDDECERFVNATEALGYTRDASVSLPRNVRHNENLVWVVDDTTHDILWERCKDLLHDDHDHFNGKKPLGLNRRFRFYKYGVGDFFKPHTDGAWPGSRVVENRLITNAYTDRYSQMTFLIFLSDGYSGGATAFYVDKNDPCKPAKRKEDVMVTSVKTPLGGALCFPHGTHPLHCLHSSEELLSGIKYIIRTDILFQL